MHLLCRQRAYSDQLRVEAGKSILKKNFNSKVSVDDILIAIKSSNIYYLLLALITFNISKIISAIALMVIFFISSIVAILPFTVGGIEARALTFLYLLEYIHSDVNIKDKSLCTFKTSEIK